MAEYYSIICIYHILFINSSAGEHLDCFHFFLAIMNNAIIYTHVLIQEFVWTCVLICLGFLFYLRIEWLGHMVTVCLTIQRLTKLLSSAAALLHSYQHSMKVLICSYSHQHLL